MSKGQKGNKEVKKPKKSAAPQPPAALAGTLPALSGASADRGKKRS